MKTATQTLVVLALALLLCGIVAVVGCQRMSNPMGETNQETAMTASNQRSMDGIRVNGTESDADHSPTWTFEAWCFGEKIVGPSPKGNWWTQTSAQYAVNIRKAGNK